MRKWILSRLRAFFTLPAGTFSLKLCIVTMRSAFMTFLIGATLNGVVYVANDFEMPVIEAQFSDEVDPANGCIWPEMFSVFSGKETHVNFSEKDKTDVNKYRLLSQAKSFQRANAKREMRFPWLADRVSIYNGITRWSKLPEPLRFFTYRLECFPESGMTVSIGDILMWLGGNTFLFLALFLWASRKVHGKK